MFLLNNICCTCKLTILEIAEYFCKKRFTDAISALSAHINESNPSPVQSLFANQAPDGSGILIISEFFLLITLHRDSYWYNENKVCNHIQNIDALIFLCHFNLILLLLVKKVIFLKIQYYCFSHTGCFWHLQSISFLYAGFSFWKPVVSLCCKWYVWWIWCKL